MLLKLFKYDFKASARYGVPLLLIILAATILGCFNIMIVGCDFVSDSSASSAASGNMSEVIILASMSGLALIGMALAAAAAVMTVLLLVQFYRSTVSDEAYLTFTLPVSVSQLLFAKLLNVVVWSLFVGLALFAAGSAILTVGIAASGIAADLMQIFGGIFDALHSYFGQTGLTVFLACLMGAASFVSTYLQLFMAITFGSSIARRHKAITAVAMIFVINFVMNGVTCVMQFATMGSPTIQTAMYDFLAAINIYLISCTILYVVLALIYFLITKYMMEKKLNLE